MAWCVYEHIQCGYVDLIYYDMIDHEPIESRYRIPYPHEINTFSKLWCYLRAGAKGEWVKGGIS